MANHVSIHLWPAFILLSSGLATPVPSLHPASSPQDIALLIFKSEHRTLSKRDPFASTLTNLQPSLPWYVIQVTAGSTNQPIGVALDTAAYKTWFPAYEICRGSDQTCPQGSFQSGVSTTTNNEKPCGLNELYVDGETIKGKSFTGTLKIGTSPIASAQLAVATRILFSGQKSLVGNMGLSFDPESAELETAYPSVIRDMMAQNVIKIPTYSLWLNPSGGPGSIYFGGIEPNRLAGSSATLEIVQSNQEYRYMKVQYDGFAVQTPNAPLAVFEDEDSGDVEFPPTLPTTVILDSGSSGSSITASYWGLPTFMVGGCNTRDKLKVVDCDARGWTGGVDFPFNGVPIRVAFSEFIAQSTDNQNLCHLIVLPNHENEYILGTNFLRHAFVVFDLAEKKITIGQAQT